MRTEWKQMEEIKTYNRLIEGTDIARSFGHLVMNQIIGNAEISPLDGYTVSVAPVDDVTVLGVECKTMIGLKRAITKYNK